MDSSVGAARSVRFKVEPTGGPLGADIVGFPFADCTQDDVDGWTRWQA